MINKKIVYELETSTFTKLSVSLEEKGTAIVFNSGDEYQFTLSVAEFKELREVLKDISDEIDIIEDTIKDMETGEFRR